MTKQTDYKRNPLLIAAVVIVLVGAVISSGMAGLNWNFIGKYFNWPTLLKPQTILPDQERVRVTVEESVIIDVVDRVSPAVVTIGIHKTRQVGGSFEFDPFNFFGPFQRRPGREQQIEQDIGSGFIVGADGLIVTNKHVVSDSEATYKVITKDDKTYDVAKIYRDPINDMAILKINATGLPVVEMGDSGKIKVGQLAIAIGTALGEFRNTVTTGVISGIGRGITAGGFFEESAERLDNLLQTDAAINPGNSGGPLLNSSGQVVGVNIAVSAAGQNIGFALPINVVKEAITTFNQTGQFDRPYLGVRYKLVTRDIAVLNDIPEGAYIIEIVPGSPADRAGINEGDIITNMDGTRLTGANAELSKVISSKKVGETVKVTVWRDGKEQTISVVFGNQAEQ